MYRVERKGLKLVDKLIRRQSGVDNQTEQSECGSWFYQPKRPVVKEINSRRNIV